jgi:ATP-dependent Zn protease
MSEFHMLKHARERMQRYDISEELVRLTVDQADQVLETYGGRKVYQKRIDDHVLRVIVEEYKGARRIITVYPAKAERYAV